jgi:hypothetical protein
MPNPQTVNPPMTETIESAHAAASTLFLGQDGEWWDFGLILSVIAAAVVATAIGVTTAGSIIAHKREAVAAEAALVSYKLTVDAKVADAKKEGIEAGKAAGDALVRAAGLEKEAANARLETEKIKAVVAWRTLSATQNADLNKVLSARPGSVNLRWIDGDPEALFLAMQISQVLGNAKWQVAPGAFKPAGSIHFGILVPPESGADADTLRQSLQAAKIGYSAVPLSQEGASFNVTTIPGAPFLMIGSRRPVVP